MKIEEKLLHEKFVTYGANAKSWMRKCIMLLPEIQKHEIWKKKGFGSIYEYAAKLAGMSKNTVDDALRILRKIEDKPALQKVVEEKGLGAIRPVVTMATAANETFWAEKATAMSKNTLETYVREFRKQAKEQDRPRTAEGQACPEAANGHFRPRTEKAERVTLSMDLDIETAEVLQKLKGSGDWNTLMQELLQLRKDKLGKEEPEPVKTANRYIPARIKNHVRKITNGSCAFPGCSKPYKILHHTQRFALEKVHDPRRIAPLCKGHERIAHQGLIEHEKEAPEHWHVREEPDRQDLTYEIDRRVMEHRTPGS